MKKIITLLTVFISIFGYSQTTTFPSIQDRLSQDMLDKMKPNAITSQRDAFLNINQIENVQSQSFQSEVLVKNENYNLRLDREIYLNFNGTNWRARVQNASAGNFNSLEVDQTETIKALFVLRPTSYALYANGNLIGNETRSYNGTAPVISNIANVEFDNYVSDRGITRNKELRV